jgi:hypothetical protein
MNYGVLNNHAFTMPEGQVSVEASYLRTNDELDIFNIRDSELGTLSKYGSSIGDMSGFETEFGVGISERDSLFFNFQIWNLDYASSNLKNSQIEFWNRYQLRRNRNAFIDSISFDIGYKRNWAEDISVSNPTVINSMIKKISPNSSYSIEEDGSVKDGDTEIILFDDFGNRVSPEVNIEDMASDSIYLKLLFGKRVLRRTVIDFYTAFAYQNISTKIDVFPSSIVPNSLETDLDRDETVGTLGFSLISEFTSTILELNYEYSKIWREDLSYENSSNSLEASLLFPFSKNFVAFLGGKLMFQQLNTEIPYLYNRYTETQFDKKYGFAKFGLIYKIGAF